MAFVAVLRSAVVSVAYYLCAIHPNGVDMLGTVHNTKVDP
jgi:hypothetical protein